MHGTTGLSHAVELLCKAARTAMFGLHYRCQQLGIHDLALKREVFDTLVGPIMIIMIICYCCDLWYALGGKVAHDDLEQSFPQLRFGSTAGGCTIWKWFLQGAA